MTFDYYDKETYITVDSKDSDASSLAITLYLDDNYLPQYCMQSIDSAVMRTTWTVDEYGRCVDTLIESTSEGYSLTEKYEIYYTDNKMSNVKYYVPDNDGAPRISTDTEYTYSENGEFIAQTETKYDSAGELLQISVYDYSDDLVEKTTIEYYTEGVREKTEISSKAYDSNGHVTESSQYEILADGTYSVAKKTSLAYDDAGNLSSRTTYFYDTTNTLENYLTETYTYDGYGKVLKAEYIAYDSAETCIERELDEFVYDGNNVITTSVSMFDANNKLISKTVTEKKYDSEGKETSSVVTTYDSEGNVVQSK